MSCLQSWARGSACLAFSFCACGADVLEVGYECAGLEPGALVVTEIHANPDGSDADREYIELFNRSDTPVSLVGITLATSRADGSSQKGHRLQEGSAESKGYVVLGNAGAGEKPVHIDYSYGDALGNLRNSDGSISVWCGDQMLDQVSYAKTTDGRALELDGRLAPQADTNDDPSAWCATPEGAGEMGDGNFGTPGRRNSPCHASSLEGTCVDGDSVRASVAPRPGDVHITEWMPNPKGLDAGLEWVELRFDASVDLNGLQLGSSVEALNVVVDRDSCFPVDAGTRAVFGASPAAAPRIDGELGFSLGNSGPRSVVAGIDGVALDVVRYQGATEGVAWQLDEDGETCLAGQAREYAPGNFGTPGEPNPPCVPALGPGMCLDDGVPRAIVSPAAGQAHITEWMADPEAAGNREGEWVEILFDVEADLNGLSVVDLTGSVTPIESERCLSLGAGARAVLVRSVDSLVNGGIENAAAALSVSLNNRDETISLHVDGRVLDSVDYARSVPGVATQVDDSGRVCSAATPYGDGDLGTPGQPNPWCV